MRRGRERGCWVYILGSELEAASFSTSSPPPFYRTWPQPDGAVLVRLYTEA